MMKIVFNNITRKVQIKFVVLCFPWKLQIAFVLFFLSFFSNFIRQNKFLDYFL